MRRIHDTNLVFVHVPKTAGQSIVNAFGLEHITTDHDNIQDKKYFSPPYVRFLVIRDPVSRFISAYNYNMEQPVWDYKSPTHLLRRIVHSTDNINDFIQLVLDKRINPTDSKTSPVHFIPQSRYIDINKPNIILKFENLNNDIKKIIPFAKKYYKGLKVINKSKETNSVKIISEKSIGIIRQWYGNDEIYYRFTT